MSSVDKAMQTQLNNIQSKTGKTLDELTQMVRTSGLSKHGEIRSMLMNTLGLTYGDANTLAHAALQSAGEHLAQGKTTGEVVDELYAGAKAGLRPIHDRLMAEIERFGEYEIAPKKGYLSLRRKRQFAMIGPATNSRVEVGLNAKELPADERLLPQPSGSMCSFKVRVTSPSEVDEKLIEWIRRAYEAAG